MEYIKPKKIAVVFYGGGMEAAASYAVLSALKEKGFSLSRVTAVGMSAVGAMAWLADAEEQRFACVLETIESCMGGCPREAEKLLVRTVTESRGENCRLSELPVPLTIMTVDAEKGRTVVFGEKRIAETEKLLFLQDAALSETVEASLSPWIRAFPQRSRAGMLCGIPSEAGIRYLRSDAVREERETVLYAVFLPEKSSAFDIAVSGQQTRIAQLLSESLRELDPQKKGNELLLCLQGKMSRCFAMAREQVLREKEHLLLSI